MRHRWLFWPIPGRQIAGDDWLFYGAIYGCCGSGGICCFIAYLAQSAREEVGLKLCKQGCTRRELCGFAALFLATFQLALLLTVLCPASLAIAVAGG